MMYDDPGSNHFLINFSITFGHTNDAAKKKVQEDLSDGTSVCRDMQSSCTCGAAETPNLTDMDSKAQGHTTFFIVYKLLVETVSCFC